MYKFLLIFLMLSISLFSLLSAERSLETDMKYTYETDKWRFDHYFWWFLMLQIKEEAIIDHFSEETNTYGSLVLVDKATSSVKFRIRSSPVSKLWISPDSKYIVALSEFIYMNPVQILILDANDGNLLYRKSFSMAYIKLTHELYHEFVEKFPDFKVPEMYLTYQKDHILIDSSFMEHNLVWKNKEVSAFLFTHWLPARYPDYAIPISFYRSSWYNAMNPNIRLNYDESGKPKELLVNGKDGKDLIFKIPEDFIPCR